MTLINTVIRLAAFRFPVKIRTNPKSEKTTSMAKVARVTTQNHELITLYLVTRLKASRANPRTFMLTCTQ